MDRRASRRRRRRSSSRTCSTRSIRTDATSQSAPPRARVRAAGPLPAPALRQRRRRRSARSSLRGLGLPEGGHGLLRRAVDGRHRRLRRAASRAVAPHLDRSRGELSPIERAILVIGAWELQHRLEIPYRVVINEAVELAKIVRRHRRPQVRQRRARQARGRRCARPRSRALARGARRELPADAGASRRRWLLAASASRWSRSRRRRARAPLVVYCSHDPDACELAAQTFTRDTGIAVAITRKPTGEFYAQLRAERDNPKADVWYGGTIDPFLQGAAEGLFAPYRSPRLAELHPGRSGRPSAPADRVARDLPDHHRLRHQPGAAREAKRCRRRAAGRTSSKPEYRERDRALESGDERHRLHDPRDAGRAVRRGRRVRRT